MDSTFYALPTRERLESWRLRTPAGFTMALKMPGEVTHQSRLADPRLAHRFCDEVRALGDRLGPVLVQLPPDFGPDGADRLFPFLESLPADLRIAVEFRDRRWLTADTLHRIEDAGTALALSMGPWLGGGEGRRLAPDAPGPLLYLRWMGAPRHQRELSDVLAERDAEIAAWGELVPGLEHDEVYAFFNNDFQGHGPRSARRLQAVLGQDAVPPKELTPQRDLFG